MSPAEFRLIGGKTFVAEKHQDAVDKQADRQAEQMSKEMLKEQQVNLKDVPDVSKSENPIIEKNKRLAEERLKDKKKKQKKQKKRQKLLEQESGLMIDLEG